MTCLKTSLFLQNGLCWCGGLWIRWSWRTRRSTFCARSTAIQLPRSVGAERKGSFPVGGKWQPWTQTIRESGDPYNSLTRLNEKHSFTRENLCVGLLTRLTPKTYVEWLFINSCLSVTLLIQIHKWKRQRRFISCQNPPVARFILFPSKINVMYI